MLLMYLVGKCIYIEGELGDSAEQPFLVFDANHHAFCFSLGVGENLFGGVVDADGTFSLGAGCQNIVAAI
jgi:hypothetical protein